VKAAHVIDFPLLHAVGSSDQLQNNANNIKGLAFYHEIRWSLEIRGSMVRKLSPHLAETRPQEHTKDHVEPCSRTFSPFSPVD
jgi:hypothetical protein